MIICLTRSTVKNVHNFRPLFIALFFCLFTVLLISLHISLPKLAFLSYFFFFLLILNDSACFFSQRLGMFSLPLLARYILVCVYYTVFERMTKLISCLCSGEMFMGDIFVFLSFILRLRMESNHTIKIKSMFSKKTVMWKININNKEWQNTIHIFVPFFSWHNMNFELNLQLTSIIHHGFFSVALCFFHALVSYRIYIIEYWFTVAIYRKLFSYFSWQMLNWNFPLFSNFTHFSKHPRFSLDSQLFLIFSNFRFSSFLFSPFFYFAS